MKKIFVSVILICMGSMFLINVVPSKSNAFQNLTLMNLEALAQKEGDKPTHTSKCWMDKEITATTSPGTGYTICDPRTTSDNSYKCLDMKRGKFTYPNSEYNYMHCNL